MYIHIIHIISYIRYKPRIRFLECTSIYGCNRCIPLPRVLQLPHSAHQPWHRGRMRELRELGLVTRWFVELLAYIKYIYSYYGLYTNLKLGGPTLYNIYIYIYHDMEVSIVMGVRLYRWMAYFHGKIHPEMDDSHTPMTLETSICARVIITY